MNEFVKKIWRTSQYVSHYEPFLYINARNIERYFQNKLWLRFLLHLTGFKGLGLSRFDFLAGKNCFLKTVFQKLFMETVPKLFFLTVF